jgi:predicted RNA-binding Zn-ribbon protein involved in translation (DUF1610 family)
MQHKLLFFRNVKTLTRSLNFFSPYVSFPCPICGGVMIKHVAKRGANSGREFWGCANYPNCKGTKNL